MPPKRAHSKETKPRTIAKKPKNAKTMKELQNETNEEKIETRSERLRGTKDKNVGKVESKKVPEAAPKAEKSKKPATNNEEKPVEVQEKSAKAHTKNLKNRTETDWESIDFTCSRKNAEENPPNFKITSWNIGGLKAWMGKDCLKILQYDSPDIFCVQETKCDVDKIPEMDISDYKAYWRSSDESVHAGVGLFSKIEPINVQFGIEDEEQDKDGRCITAEFEKFYLVNVLVPNAGRTLVTLNKRLKWNESFENFIKKLDCTKPVIICGDMNVAHNEIDLKNPKASKKNAGFTQEERDGMTDFLNRGFIDTFRHLYPDKEDVFTFWTYMRKSRKKNNGWRLDYFIVSDRIKKKICDNVVHNQIYGSNHCPISLFLNI